MSQQSSRPTLNQLRRVCPQDLANCEGYVWHLGTKIGKGSFGDVYLGWTKDGTTEVAVKVVRKEFFKQDPKVRENLEREIRILKLLRGCEYVVHLLHVQELKQCIVLVMELCDYDLDHLVKVEPFKEETVIIFLYQLAEGMKALRDQNIVHRDLKPGNILIKRHPTTGKMMIKLADFGFARHFKDEGNKTIDMTSLAGTPVFMAPEALSCVFHPGEHYDDKVDIWSIGALLYKCMVGQCGFYAQLQDIPRILKHKGDAIAFERAQNRKINYIYELPASVNSRLSESFRDKMKTLLCSMLKLDPRERMTFTEFFETVDDIIRSKIEIINLLHGTSLKVISDLTLTPDVLIEKARIQWHVPSVGQIIFSPAYPHYLAPNSNISQEQFVELLEKAGGSEGHAKLYLLPFNQLNQNHVSPDSTCFTSLKYTVDDRATIVNLITEQKFADEIVHMIGYMGSQQKLQLEGLEQVARFASAEYKAFMSDLYPCLLEQIHQAVAKASLASQWLSDDLAQSNTQHGQLTSLLSSLDSTRVQLLQHLQELNAISSIAIPELNCATTKEEITKNTTLLSERAKKLPRMTGIQPVCKVILDDCLKEISGLTSEVKSQLMPFSDAITSIWTLKTKSATIFDRCTTINQFLVQLSQERSTIFKHNAEDQRIQTAALPVVTPPPGGWQNPTLVVAPGQSRPDPATVDKLKKQIDELSTEIVMKDNENALLKKELAAAKEASATSDVESTLVPSNTSNGAQVLEDLVHQLRNFCTMVDRINPEASKKGSGQSFPLYPSLPEDYSVIAMSEVENSDDVQKLLPVAKQLASDVSSSITFVETLLSRSPQEATLTSTSALVRIGRPEEYHKGDVVLFTPVKTVKSKSTITAMLHLGQNKPYVLLDSASYSLFNIRPGRMPELFLAMLSEAPRAMKFQENRSIASDVGEDSGDFYQVKAEPVQLKFSAQRGTPSPIPSHPGKPSRSGGLFNPFHKPHHGKSDKEFV